MVCYRRAIKLGWVMFMHIKQCLMVAAIAAGVAASPASGQFGGTETEQFVAAVRARDGNKATDLIRARPTTVNARDYSGDTGLLIAIGRRDDQWTAFLLDNGADPDATGRNGERPLTAAARIGFGTAIAELLARKAKVDAGNKMGETALIVAVQQRHVPIVRTLLAAGADPDKADSAAGYSARDYAKRDPRAREILRLIETRKPKP